MRLVQNGRIGVHQGDMKITKWYVEVGLPNPKVETKYRPLYEQLEDGRLRVANEEDLIILKVDEILFFDTYKQAEVFAERLQFEYRYYTQVKEYVT